MSESEDTKSKPWPLRVGSLLLREVKEEDLDGLLKVRNNTSVNKFMFRTFVEPDIFRTEWLAVATSTTDFSCIAEWENEPIGMGYLEIVDGMGQPGKPLLTEATIAYIVDPDHWGKGFGASIARGLMDTAFGPLGVRRVTATCNADNPASVRILEGLGMRCEQHGVADSWHDELGWIDGFQYAILKEEWFSRQANDGERSNSSF